MPTENEQKIDFRIYIGIIFFRWQIIAVCFLYCMLGGILYVNLATKIYLSQCKVMVYKEKDLEVNRERPSSPWGAMGTHIYLLQSAKLRDRAAERLFAKWGKQMGGKARMMLPVVARYGRGLSSTLDINVRCINGDYGTEFLTVLVEELISESSAIQRQASESVAEMLEVELTRLEDKIRVAEDDLIEYQRLNDIARVSARSSMESRYLGALVSRRSQLTTELMLLEAQTPELKNENVGVISSVAALTRETGAIEPEADLDDIEQGVAVPEAGASMLPSHLRAQQGPTEDDEHGWPALRVNLLRLKQQEKDLLKNLMPEHPQVRSVKKEIEDVERQLEVQAQIYLGSMRDRHRALTIQLNAITEAEYKWQAKHLLASQRHGEMKRIAGVVTRYEQNYHTLYGRLHDLRVSEELKAEHWRVVEPAATLPRPVWPDAMKILLVALALGLGSGFGIALIAHVLDNKVQSIDDVEQVLKIPFLGGVPYWVHSGLETAIRSIVTEEHSTGAVEAYRSVRTALLAALDKANEKIVFITSADSQEGKTLTTLNVAIMITQMNKKVLLIDMDLRRGRIHRSLGQEKEPGMTDVLRSGGELKEVIRETRIENLHLIPSGATADNCAEMLQAANLNEMFAAIEDDYDYILIDTSPILRVTDTVIACTQGVGVVVYVARVNKTPKPLILYSLDMLHDANVIGLIMNSIEMHKISSLYYAYQYPNYSYYSNAYAYGHNYYYYDDARSRQNRGGRRRRRSVTGVRKKAAEWLRRTFLPMS
ncbi:MAG: polysaccharide biosynthesis tyrosine autokinase [Lentisphaerae bacterium]|nr:polysaccharide biosynthesis tyrosine autokinase [Lentisphaerota bacterium]